MRNCAGTAIALAIAGWPSLAPAQTNDTGVWLTYDAPPGCPTGDDFVARVRSRTSLLKLAPEGTPARRVSTSIVQESAQEGAVYQGRLHLEEPDGTATDRDVPGATCEDVADALALVLALAVDPQARIDSSAPAELPGETPAATPTGPEATTPLPAPSTAPTTGAPPNRVPAPDRKQDRAPLGALLTGVEGQARGGLSPDVFGMLAAFVAIGSRREDLLSPLFRGAVAVGTSGSVSGAFGDASFLGIGIQLEACPLRWRPSLAVLIAPCVNFDALLLKVRAGPQVPEPGSATRPWFAPGALLRLAWLGVDPLRFELFGGVSAPLYRDRFYVRPDTTVYKAPGLAGSGGLGVAYRFR